MADRLTADQISRYSRRNLRDAVTRTLTIDNDAISETDVTSKVRVWGDLRTAVFNKHPDDRGDLNIPVTTVSVDNTQGEFNFGGAYFPNGISDLASTVAHLTIQIGSLVVVDFTGAVLEPEIDGEKIFSLIIEHPLVALTQRKWIREDRIGGDTGINGLFNS